MWLFVGLCLLAMFVASLFFVIDNGYEIGSYDDHLLAWRWGLAYVAMIACITIYYSLSVVRVISTHLRGVLMTTQFPVGIDISPQPRPPRAR